MLLFSLSRLLTANITLRPITQHNEPVKNSLKYPSVPMGLPAAKVKLSRHQPSTLSGEWHHQIPRSHIYKEHWKLSLTHSQSPHAVSHWSSVTTAWLSAQSSYFLHQTPALLMDSLVSEDERKWPHMRTGSASATWWGHPAMAPSSSRGSHSFWPGRLSNTWDTCSHLLLPGWIYSESHG